jgi:hypothetical protein
MKIPSSEKRKISFYSWRREEEGKYSDIDFSREWNVIGMKFSLEFSQFSYLRKSQVDGNCLGNVEESTVGGDCQSESVE